VSVCVGVSVCVCGGGSGWWWVMQKINRVVFVFEYATRLESVMRGVVTLPPMQL
jgi:hypothetical protein